MPTVNDVAAAVLEQTGSITTMKLEKMVYYCQCWQLASTNTPLFDEAIEAWQQGPVVPALFRQHRGLYAVDSWPSGDSSALTGSQRQIVDWVVANYGEFSASELSMMTHSELPWLVARDGLPDDAKSSTPLSNDVICNYYSRQRADLETAIGLTTASAALEGVVFDEEWKDKLRDVGSSITADELIAQEIARFR